MKSYYKRALDELLDVVEKSCDALQKKHELIDDSMGELVFLRDSKYNIYKSIIEANEYRAAKSIELIAIELFTKLKTHDFSIYTPSDETRKYPTALQKHSKPFEIVLNENNQQIGLFFSNICDAGKITYNFVLGKYKVDNIKLIILSAPDKISHEALFADVNTMNNLSGIHVERVPLLTFWKQYFGQNECDELIEFINLFNEKSKKIIGYNTVVSPTKKAIEKFKIKCRDTLINASVFQNIPKDFSVDYETLKYNYLERQLWLAMISDNNFAISFITSEWFYNMYQLTENLDLTTVVSGYLKSIEQLLFAIIKLSEGTGITIKGKDKGVVELTKDNEDIIDTTLWALENVIKYNDKILVINKYAKNCLLEIIDNWRGKQRNGYFHKHNLHSLDKVEEIRETALQLYFLILGSFSIKDEQFVQLGIEI